MSLPSAAPGAQNAAASPLQEIVVTAEKRAEGSQDVGVSLMAMDAETLESLSLFSLPEAASMIPNVEMFEDFTGADIPTWVIRGVGLQDFNANNTPTAAVYLDEVYQTSTVMGGAALFDVEQLVVLKGPQGGLYGRNTSGGAVLLNTRRAEPGRRSGYLSGSYGRWDNRRLEGAANLPFGDSLALRVSGQIENGGDAWQSSLVSGRPHGEKELWDLRSWLHYQPLPGLRLEWKIQGGVDDSEIPLGLSVGLYGPAGGFCQPVLEGRRDPAQCLSFAGLNGVLQGASLPPVSVQANDGALSLSDPLNRQSNEYLSNSLFVTLELSQADLISITSLDRFDYGVTLDLDGSPGVYAHRVSSSDIEVASQELRLVSREDRPFSWLLGLNLSEERFVEGRDFLFNDNFLVVRQIGVGQGRLEYDQNTSSRALYGSLDYAASEKLSLIATLRYTDEDKEYRDGTMYVPLDPPVFLLRDLNRDYSLDSRLSGKLGWEWEPDENMLFYGSFSRGFKSGGFYGGFPTSSPEEVSPYREETIDAWEAGFKTDWPGLAARLNGAVFYYDYQDVQSFVTRESALTGTLIDVLANPADAVHKGMELQLQWFPLEQLELDINLGYLDAVFNNARQLSANLHGDLVPIHGRRPFAPRWSGSGLLSYRQVLADSWQWKGTLSYHYRSDFSGELSTPADRAVNKLEGYGLWNGRVDIDSMLNNWSFSVWVKNLLNERYLSRVKSDGLMGYLDLFGEPRSFGATVEYAW